MFLPVSEIADAFKRSQYGREMNTTLTVPYNKEKALPSSLAMTKYAVSKKELLKACFSRELLLLSRHRFLYIFKTCQVCSFFLPSVLLLSLIAHVCSSFHPFVPLLILKFLNIAAMLVSST